MDSALSSSSLLDIKMSIVAFSSICACASAELLRAQIVLRSASACRVEWLCRARVALARLAGQYGTVVTPRGPGAMHVLSIHYKLPGNEVVPSAELTVRL